MEFPDIPPAFLGALPAITALLRAIWPKGERGLALRFNRLTKFAEKAPEGDGRTALEAAASKIGQEIAFRETKAARRRFDGVNLFAMLLFFGIGGGAGWWLWGTDILFWQITGVVIGVGLTLFALIGGGSSIFKDADKFRFEEVGQHDDERA